MDEKKKSTLSLAATFAVSRPPQQSFGPSPFIKPLMPRKSPAVAPTLRTCSLKLTPTLASREIVVNFDESKIGSSKVNLSAISAPLYLEDMYCVDSEGLIVGVPCGMFSTAPPPWMTLPISELASKNTAQRKTGPDFGESKTDSIEAMLSHISAPPGLLGQIIGIYNPAETLDLILKRVSGFKDHAPYADCFVDVEGSVEGRYRSISGGFGGVVIRPRELTAPRTGRFGDPFEFGFSRVGVSVEHGGENSSGNGGSGAENAGEERNRSRGGGGNGNERIGGGRQCSRNEGRLGGLGAGGHGGDNGDDDGNNGRDRNHRIVDIENERIPQRNPRQEELVQIYFPIIVGIIGFAFNLDDANLSDLGLALRSFAFACCVLGIVCFTGSLLERGRNERMARILSIIGSTFTALALTSIIAIKLLPTLLVIIGLAILALLAIFHRSF